MTTYNILALGVAPGWLATAEERGYTVEKRNESANIQKSIDQMMGDIKSFQNTTITREFLDPDDPENWEMYLKALKSRKWDAISLGGGVRTIPQLGDYFTQAVHQAIKDQPGAKLLFPLLPHEMVPAIRKYLPEAN